MTKDEQFFYDHGGYSFNPKTETAEQGRVRCAKRLAEAESHAIASLWEYKWTPDWLVDHQKEFGDTYKNGGPETCESCTLYTLHPKALASLHCIDDATPEYRRVVQAELALEAMHSDDSFVEIQKEKE